MRTSQPITLLLACGTLAFGQPSGCKFEIASVKDLKGTWRDDRYARLVRPNQSICDDSRIVRIKDAKATPDDFLLLKNRQAQDLPAYQCKHLLGCEAPLDLADVAREAKRQLEGRSFLQSFLDWSPVASTLKSSLSRNLPDTVPPSLQAVVVVAAGGPIPASAVFRPHAARQKYMLDLCRGAVNGNDCGNTLPQRQEFTWEPGANSVLPFAPLSRGLHLLYRLDDQDPVLRTGDVSYILAVAPGLLTEAQDKVSLALRAAATSDDPDAARASVLSYLEFLAAEMKRPPRK